MAEPKNKQFLEKLPDGRYRITEKIIVDGSKLKKIQLTESTKMVEIDSEDYRKEALEIAKKELKIRGFKKKKQKKKHEIYNKNPLMIFDLSDKDLVGAGWKILKMIDKESGCYKKIVLKDNKLKGAIMFGEKKAIPYINRNIELEVNENELRDAIELYKWVCGGCGNIYDEGEMRVLFKNLPDDWTCSNCKSDKSSFTREE